MSFLQRLLSHPPRGLRVAVATLLFAATAVATGPAAAETVIDTEAALKERVVGDPAAPVTIIEYASMTCPDCGRFHNNTYKAFKEGYIDTGKVRMIYRDFPWDEPALRAAMMARCTVDERYFGLVQVIYQYQQNWTHASDPMEMLANIGKLAGIDEDRFNACMASEELLNGVLRMRQQGTTDGVSRTPSFIIDNKIYAGSRSLEELAKIIDPMLEDK